MRIVRAVALAAILGGCATLMEGTKQSITVEVSPKTGTCTLTRNDLVIGISTPQMRVVQIDKAYADIVFNCSAPGHEPRQIALSSALSAATVISFFLVDFGIVDTVSGAARKYPERVTIILDPIELPPAPAPSPKKRRG